MKYFALLLLQLCFMTAAIAADQEGYILNANGDTVKGKVDVETRKIGFGKKELDLGGMEQSISFSENEGKFKKFNAGDIAGYGFNFNDVWYHFVILDFSKNTWKKSMPGFSKKVREATIFIHRAMDGAVTLYKHYTNVTTTTIGGSGTSKSVSTNIDLYIMSTDLGYVEVAPPNFNANRKLKEFLMKYLGLEEGFLKMVDDKARFSDAEEVLRSYNDWKRTN